MSGEKKMSTVDFYKDTFQTWSNIWNTWSGSSAENWTKQYQNVVPDWSKMFTSFSETMKNTPWGFDMVKDMGEVVGKGLSSSVKICNDCFKSADRINKKAIETGLKMMKGDEVDAVKFLDMVKEAYGDMVKAFEESLENTPFSAIRDINKAISQSLDSFPEEHKLAKEFFQGLVSLNQKMLSTSFTMAQKGTKSFNDMMGGGKVSEETLNDLREAYTTSLRNSADIFKPLGGFIPNYDDMAEGAICISEKNFSIYVSWLEVSSRFWEEAAKSMKETYTSGKEIFKEGNVFKAGEIYKNWAEAYKSQVNSLMGSSRAYASIPRFISEYTECVKTVNSFYRKLVTVPYATKEDLEKLSESKVSCATREDLEKLSGELEKLRTLVSSELQKISAKTATKETAKTAQKETPKTAPKEAPKAKK